MGKDGGEDDGELAMPQKPLGTLETKVLLRRAKARRGSRRWEGCLADAQRVMRCAGDASEGMQAAQALEEEAARVVAEGKASVDGAIAMLGPHDSIFWNADEDAPRW